MVNYLKVKHILIVCLFLFLCLDKIVEANEPNDQNYLAAWQNGKYIQLRGNTDNDKQIARYNIYRSLTTDDEWEKLDSSPLLIDSFVDYSPFQNKIVYYKITRLLDADGILKSGLKYHWNMRAKTGENWSDFSNYRYLPVISEEIFPTLKQSLSRDIGASPPAVSEKNESGVKSFFSRALFGGNSMLVIIIVLFILAVGTIIGIKFLRKEIHQSEQKNSTETSEAVERLTEIMNQLEETSENGERKTENTAGKMSSELKSQTLKEGSKKSVHQVQETTASKDETASQKQKLEEYLDDDEISTLIEKLAKLADEYEETYQTLRQRIANKYKQLQEASEYIDAQVEKLNKLTSNNSIEYEGQEEKHPSKYAKVHELAEQGIDGVEIARKIGLPVGEVDLLLSLNDNTKSKDLND